VRVALVIAAAAAAATAVAVAGVLARDGGDPAALAPVAEHTVPVPAEAREVLVSRAMPLPSAHARRLSAMLERGTMPSRPVAAEVLTDTECEPDAELVSRCRNEVRLTGGDTLVLRHPHRMTEVPCLAPGETVRLVPVDA
jgi:hypothetical protein